MDRSLIFLAECDGRDQDRITTALDELSMADVLVLEDGESVVDFFLGYLSFHPTAVRSRPEAVAPCDLLLMDVALPRLDGIKVLRQLRWLFRADCSLLPPIVMMSSTADPELASAAYRYGADGFLCKTTEPPSFTESLHQTVRYWLNNTLRRGAIPRVASPGTGTPQAAIRSTDPVTL